MAINTKASWYPPHSKARARGGIRATDVADVFEWAHLAYASRLAQTLADISTPPQNTLETLGETYYYRIKTPRRSGVLASTMAPWFYADRTVAGGSIWDLRVRNLTSATECEGSVNNDTVSEGWWSPGSVDIDETAAYQDIAVDVVDRDLSIGSSALTAFVGAFGGGLAAGVGGFDDGFTAIDSILYAGQSFLPVDLWRRLHLNYRTLWEQTGQIITSAFRSYPFVDGGTSIYPEVEPNALLIHRLPVRVPAGVGKATFHCKAGAGDTGFGVSINGAAATYQTMSAETWGSQTVTVDSSTREIRLLHYAGGGGGDGDLVSVCGWWEDAVYG